MNLQRCEILLGSKQLQKVKNSCILVFGVGGVGGYAVEMLVRSGVGKIILVDSDKVDETNINRQIIALNSTIGQSKVSVMQKRIADINPDCVVTTFEERVTKDNVSKFFEGKIDFVVDAIDSLLDKVALIKYCKQNNIKVYAPVLSLCTDNAAMIASAAYYNLKSGIGLADLSLTAKSTLPIEN